MTLESWFSNLEQTPTRQVSLPALFKLLARYSRHVFKQRTEQNNLIIPISTDLHHLNLIANNITAKLTIPFTRTGRITLDWQQLFNRLWWWLLPLRLPTRQSPLPTEVLFGATVTRTIKLHHRMCLLFLHVWLLSSKETSADKVYCWKTRMISLKTICFIPGFARLLKKMDDHAHIFSNPEEFLCPSEIVARPLHFCSSGNWANEQREPLHPENMFQY